MRYLLDTHAFLWAVGKADLLGEYARDIFESPENVLYLSVASAWEIAIKVGLGKLTLRKETRQFMHYNIRKHGLNILEITLEDSFTTEILPDHHKDPFDRMLIAQATNHGLPIVTKDTNIRRYDVHTVW